MIVIADTSPLIALIQIDHVGILPKLYGSVIIPPAVAHEMASRKRSPQVQAFMSEAPSKDL